ncbi:MAG: universal stress protein [Deltaproteobacteria bacterium]|nr:universal stress protein [Deltaproteobacteria bacterium]
MYNKIMVPLDGSDLAECVLPHVEILTSGGEVSDVVLVRVINPLRLPISVPAQGKYGFTEKDREKLESNRKKSAETYLAGQVDRLIIPGANLSYEVLEGNPADTLADYATRNEVDLIVIASHGRSGVSRWVMGSVADRIVQNSCVPVLVVRAPGCEPKVKG